MIVARYWAASDREDDDEPPDDYWPPWYGDASAQIVRSDREVGRMLAHQHSGRREKLFANAFKTLRAAARLRGADDRPYPFYHRNGRRMGLYVMIGRDHEMHWSPRGGYRIVDVEAF